MVCVCRKPCLLEQLVIARVFECLYDNVDGGDGGGRGGAGNAASPPPSPRRECWGWSLGKDEGGSGEPAFPTKKPLT